MQSTSPESGQGGDPPCWSHLFDDHVDPLGPVPWAALVEQLADAVLVADAEGTITYWNAAAQRVFGWPSDAAVGRSLDLIVPERYRRRHWDGYRQAVAAGTTRYADALLEVPALHRDGHQMSIAFSVTLLRDVDGAVTRIVAVVRDDSDRWQERKELRAAVALQSPARDRR